MLRITLSHDTQWWQHFWRPSFADSPGVGKVILIMVALSIVRLCGINTIPGRRNSGHLSIYPGKVYHHLAMSCTLFCSSARKYRSLVSPTHKIHPKLVHLAFFLSYRSFRTLLTKTRCGWKTTRLTDNIGSKFGARYSYWAYIQLMAFPHIAGFKTKRNWTHQPKISLWNEHSVLEINTFRLPSYNSWNPGTNLQLFE